MSLHAHESGVIRAQIFDAHTSSQGDVSVELDAPGRNFALQVVGSTSAEVTLYGSLTSESTVGATLIAWSSDTVGSVLSTQSTGALSRITGSVIGGGSSGVDAWFSAAP